MIRGLGLDIVDLRGFREQLALPGTRLEEGVFTEAERREAGRRPDRDPARHLAARYAAKEAFVKAWSGARFGRTPVLAGVDLREIEVVSDGYGRPTLELHGRLAELAGDLRVHLSLSHDGEVAAAVVVLEG